MPKTSKASASKVESVEGILEDRSEDLDGYTAGFTSFKADMDPAPFFQGLPDSSNPRSRTTTRLGMLSRTATARLPPRSIGKASSRGPGTAMIRRRNAAD